MAKEVYGNGEDVGTVDDQGIVLDIDGEDFIFSMDTTPSLPDFSIDACLSSSSPSASSSSPSPPFVLDSWVNSTVTDIFADLDKIDGWNSSSVFSDDFVVIGEQKPAPACHDVIGGGGSEEGDDLGKVFLEWLKNNKDSISPEDLRNVKLKRSTIESAARRLGGGKEGMKKLLKLILDWVQNHHLQKKKHQQQPEYEQFPFHQQQQQMFVSSPISYPINVDQQISLKPDARLGLSSKSKRIARSSWIPNTSYVLDLPALTPLMVNTDLSSAPTSPYANSASNGIAVSSQPFSPAVDYRVVDPAPYWPPTSVAAKFVPSSSGGALAVQPPSQFSSSFSAQQPYKQEDRAMRSASATKEARKKRMARHRRSATLHQNYV